MAPLMGCPRKFNKGLFFSAAVYSWMNFLFCVVGDGEGGEGDFVRGSPLVQVFVLTKLLDLFRRLRLLRLLRRGALLLSLEGRHHFLGDRGVEVVWR